MAMLLYFLVGLFAAFVVTRAGIWLFRRVVSDRAALALTYAFLGGGVIIAMAGKVTPVRLGLLLAVAPLAVWLMVDWARAGTRVCPRCGRRIKRGLLSCPKCGRDLDTEARVKQ